MKNSRHPILFLLAIAGLIFLASCIAKQVVESTSVPEARVTAPAGVGRDKKPPVTTDPEMTTASTPSVPEKTAPRTNNVYNPGVRRDRQQLIDPPSDYVRPPQRPGKSRNRR